MTDDFDKVFGARPTPRPSFTDRLAREQGLPDGMPKEGVAGSGPYKPYGFLPTGNVGEHCEVRSWVAGTETAEGISFPYRFLMHTRFVGEEQLRLFLPDCIVVIDGKGLRELREKLGRQIVTFIQQWNPRVWPAPPVGEPIVERIEILRPVEAPIRTR
ncbi:hypothetical protein [Phenylobacterium sp.]|uniref:hypothetical protein n=1 Tax=Phenylobacterium sp. TaxID=1871053 RepID=UPI002715A483|nr:hypothetical protein [Phenylobacterium sp.]MDO8381015.1 hypothetical protein [Phenylobacterium sp.]